MFLVYFLVNILVILGLSNIMESFQVDGVKPAALFIIVLSILNNFISPIIKFLGMPINFITLGLFNILVNLSMVAFASKMIDGVNIFGGKIESFLVIAIIAASLSVAHVLVGIIQNKRDSK
jgi:putative membrane protein